jgi:membrane fusion protein (multidrug efflux system)
MKKNIVLSVIALVLLGTTAWLASCAKSDAGNATAKAAFRSVDVRVVTLRPTTMVDAIQVVGTVKAFEDVSIAPEEGGVVKAWYVRKGEFVKKGTVLVILKDDVIKAGYDAAQAQYQIAELNVDKQSKVFEQQGISELQYKNLQYGRDAAKANADLMKSRWDRTRITSPINGILEDDMVDEGEFAPPAMPIARVVNAGRVKILAEVPERYAGSITVGTHAVMTFDALPGDTLKGTVGYVGTTVSAANRALLAEIHIPNLGLRLKPETIAKVRLQRKTRSNAILVSENIVQLVDRDRVIVYVENNGKAEERRIRLGGRQGNQVEVIEGLRIGERLIVVGYQKLVNGQPVVVTQ